MPSRLTGGFEHLLARLLGDGHGFAGDVGLVDAAAPLQDDTVGRHPGARPQDHHVADGKLRGGNLRDRTVGVLAERRLGAQRHQGFDRAARAPERLVFERRSTR